MKMRLDETQKAGEGKFKMNLKHFINAHVECK